MSNFYKRAKNLYTQNNLRDIKLKLQNAKDKEIENFITYVSIIIDIINGELPYCEEDKTKWQNCKVEKYYDKVMIDVPSNAEWNARYTELMAKALTFYKELLKTKKYDVKMLETINDIYKHLSDANYTTNEELDVKISNLSVRFQALREMNGLPYNEKVLKKYISK